MEEKREPLSIGIALFDGAEELDWAGPWEVLSYWSRYRPEDNVEVFTVAEDNSRLIECAKGLRVLADAGLLKGRPATTHWADFDGLLAIDGSIEARRNERFVDDDDIITAAGVSAEIDMALYLVVRLHSEDRAREIKRRIQYEPEPPV